MISPAWLHLKQRADTGKDSGAQTKPREGQHFRLSHPLVGCVFLVDRLGELGEGRLRGSPSCP